MLYNAQNDTRRLFYKVALYLENNENLELTIQDLQLKFLTPSYPDINCLFFDFSQNKTLNKKKLIQIRFYFKETKDKDTTAMVRIVDRKTFLDRASYSYSGTPLKINLRENKKLRYSVTLSQNIYVEEDESKGCRMYPVGEHQDFNSCDKDFISKSLKSYAPPDFVPFWVDSDWSKVTNLTTYKMSSTYNKSVPWNQNYECIFDGTSVSDCPLPCTITSVVAKKEDETVVESGIDITFLQTVLITTTSFPNFQLSDALAKLGGAMGFWLGIGVVQVVEIVIRASQNIICPSKL